MGTRMGKSKARARKYRIREMAKIDSGIFDEKTMIALSKFYNKGIIAKLNFIIARGKEADLYISEAGNSEEVKGHTYIILKFFRIETSSFFKMEDYMVGDPRFGKINTNSKYEIVKTWCKKEYGNLEIAAKAKVHAPKPFMFNGSILAMSFIGRDSIPAPRLKDVELDNPAEMLNLILDDMRKLYRANLVHADVSEYNILISEKIPYMIDFGQAVVLKHPSAREFLKRDVRNVLSYFSKRYGVDKGLDETLKWITSAEPKTS
jgi:RIO kinase 1